jgi:hypothetical protein
MYKKIVHRIVEEHFDHPEAAAMSEEIHTNKTHRPKMEIKPQRYYPNDELIGPNLPPSYKLATTDKQCVNCRAFIPAKENVIYFQGETLPYCNMWKEIVRPEYTCDAWIPQ